MLSVLNEEHLLRILAEIHNRIVELQLPTSQIPSNRFIKIGKDMSGHYTFQYQQEAQS